jgi:hypothetical protein
MRGYLKSNEFFFPYTITEGKIPKNSEKIVAASCFAQKKRPETKISC